MEIYEMIDVNDCPLCGGAGILEEESGSGFYVMCMDCGAHSVQIGCRTEEERLSAAQRTAELWNCGKVLSSSPGE